MIFLCIPCLVLVSYFCILGIFFPKYRRYIKEGWKCFLDKLKGKKCSMSFDNKMRIAFSVWLANKNMKRAGKFFYDERNFKLTFTIIGIVFTIISIYLFILLIQFMAVPPCTSDVCAITI